MIGMLVLIYYLSVAGFMIGVTIFICVFVLNSFHREREYLADAYSASMLGTAVPLQNALGKLELVYKKVNEEMEKRNDEQVDLDDIDVGSIDPKGYVKESLKHTPGFMSSLMDAEMLLDHPTTEHRIFYLENPTKRKHFLSKLYYKFSTYFDRILNNDKNQISFKLNLKPILYVSVGVGMALALLPLLNMPVLKMILACAAVVLGGVGLGIVSKKLKGEDLTKTVLISSFATATDTLTGRSLGIESLVFLLSRSIYCLLACI